MKLPDPAVQPTVPLWPDAGQAFGLGRTRAFELARSGGLPFPVYRLGRSWRVPTAALRAALYLDQEAARPAENDGRRAREPGAVSTSTTASPLHEQRSARMLPRRGVIADRAGGGTG
jgi:hypothetical protein